MAKRSRKKPTKESKKSKRKPPSRGRTLTGKMRLFISEYLKDPSSAAKAAVRAGYSEKTAHAVANRLLKRLDVKKQVDAFFEAAQKRTDVTVERLVEHYSQFALRGPHPGEDSHYDRVTLTALDSLGKHLGMFTEKTEVEIKTGRLDLEEVRNMSPEDRKAALALVRACLHEDARKKG